ncbi:MAG: baseplate J/gp47 family protein [Candidatus Competibacteraceae bacterium]
MAEEIIQNLIFQLGQSQNERMPKELGIHFADVDERTPEDLLLFIKAFAAQVNYYGDTLTASGDWKNFFQYDQATLKLLLENKDANVPPHLALLIAFLELYRKPQEILNRLTGRHLDFYYQQVLRMEKKAAVADKAHVLLELKKNAPPVRITPDHRFSAGKDQTRVELLYAPTRVTVINNAKVESLRSVFVDGSDHGVVRYAPIANSADGVGGKLLGEDEPKWYGFGHQALPPAEVGFAIASPVLRMQEGERTVTVTLELRYVTPKNRDDLSHAGLAEAFEVFVTGEKHWLGPKKVSPSLSDDSLQFGFTLEPSEEAVVDYNAAIHGYSYTAQAPILQVLLRSDSVKAVGYSDFKGVILQRASIAVQVSNITSLKLENDGGKLDPKKAFLPFGPQPTKGSRFIVGYSEAFSKKLSYVSINVKWKDAPSDFANRYKKYGLPDDVKVSNDYFTATVILKDGGDEEITCSTERLFQDDTSSGIFILARESNPLWKGRTDGFITFILEKDFLHSTYRQKYVENLAIYSKTGGALDLPDEPYTPAIQSITFDYKAHSDQVNISSDSQSDFANDDIHFFHIAYFGQMREHGYQRKQFSFLSNKEVSLLPEYQDKGELLIGFSKLNAGDSVSVLFQVAEGSADPGLERQTIQWSVLCDNYWKPLDKTEVVLDTTNQLLASGIIQFIIPPAATTRNTILPADRIWLKAAVVNRYVTAVSQLVRIVANAVEVVFIDHGNDPNHLSTVLEKGRITKLKNGLAAVKSVTQPYASFDGRPVETDTAFHTRVAERLRHKNRCITAWDYERIILEAFPQVHKVKCIPHAKKDKDSWRAPGNVLIVVIPDLKNRNAVDPLQPKVDTDTLSRIHAYVQRRAGMGVKITVTNPTYQKIQLDFQVEFQAGLEFNYYSTILQQALIRFLSPWAYETDCDITFGGKIYKSVLLDFVEDLDYVDYIIDFKMYSYNWYWYHELLDIPIGKIPRWKDISETQPGTPDTILVSESSHIIRHPGEDSPSPVSTITFP